MKLVTVRCRPILGTDFACKAFVQIQVCQCLFGDVGPTPHGNIQAGGEPTWYTTLLAPKSSHFCRICYKKAKCSPCLRCNYVNMNRL